MYSNLRIFFQLQPWYWLNSSSLFVSSEEQAQLPNEVQMFAILVRLLFFSSLYVCFHSKPSFSLGNDINKIFYQMVSSSFQVVLLLCYFALLPPSINKICKKSVFISLSEGFPKSRKAANKCCMLIQMWENNYDLHSIVNFLWIYTILGSDSWFFFLCFFFFLFCIEWCIYYTWCCARFLTLFLSLHEM